jgi:hypothetical protein
MQAVDPTDPHCWKSAKVFELLKLVRLEAPGSAILCNTHSACKRTEQGQDADHHTSLGCGWEVIRGAVGAGGAEEGIVVRATARAVGIAACVLPAGQCRSRCVKEGRFV